MPEQTTIRAADVLNQTMPKGVSALTDSEVLAACEKCQGLVALDSCSVQSGRETAYNCRQCGQTLLIIGAKNPDGRPWPGRGYRIGDFVLRNAVDLLYRGIRLNRSPAALAKERPPQ